MSAVLTALALLGWILLGLGLASSMMENPDD